MSQRVYESEELEKRKRMYGWLAVLLLLLILVVLVNLRFTEIRVSGNTRYTDEEVVEMVLPGIWDRNPVYAFLKNKFGKHKSHPFVSSYDVRLTGPLSCEIILYEKAPIGCIDYMSSLMYFDKDGIIIESGTKRFEDIPEITGLKFGEIILGKKLEIEDSGCYDRIMNTIQQLSTYGISCSGISFDTLKNMTITVDGGRIKVKLGNDEYLTAKLAVLGDVIEEMRSRNLRGTADLSGYRDRSSDGFTFVPDESQPYMEETEKESADDTPESAAGNSQ